MPGFLRGPAADPEVFGLRCFVSLSHADYRVQVTRPLPRWVTSVHPLARNTSSLLVTVWKSVTFSLYWQKLTYVWSSPVSF